MSQQDKKPAKAAEPPKPPTTGTVGSGDPGYREKRVEALEACVVAKKASKDTPVPGEIEALEKEIKALKEAAANADS